jgi:hypothetical protein
MVGWGEERAKEPVLLAPELDGQFHFNIARLRLRSEWHQPGARTTLKGARPIDPEPTLPVIATALAIAFCSPSLSIARRATRERPASRRDGG